MASPPGTDPLLGKTISGYRIIERIGEGGMGTVYKANQLALDRVVAFKVLPEELSGNPQFIARFEREAKLLAKLRHPNIVSIIDKGQQDNYFYLVMEYIPGGSLKDYMDSRNLSVDEKCKIFFQLCEALFYLHENGVIHRDIKPGNILIDEGDIPKLTDFGLAKMLGGEHPRFAPDVTRTGVIVGTPDYMAPEQRTDAKVDHRADLYSMGVVFYEMLTGRIPKAMSGPPSRFDNSVSPQLDRIVAKLLQEDPEQRFQSAGELLVALEDATGLRSPRRRQLLAREAAAERTVTCVICGRASSADSRTCDSCGSALWETCPECGKEYPLADGSCKCQRLKAILEEARELQSRGDRSAAKSLLRRAIDLDPENRSVQEMLESIEADTNLKPGSFEKVTYSAVMFALIIAIVIVFVILIWKLGLL